MDTTVQVLNSPLFVALVSVGATALITLVIAALKMVVMLTQLRTEVAAMRADISELKNDPDVMRWSNYGRAVQAFGHVPPTPGSTP